jgi:hypothetical protein
MRETIAGFLCAAILLFVFFPEQGGKVAHKIRNEFMVGWDSVR